MKRPQLTIPQETKTTPTEVVGWAQSLVRLHARIASRFARPEPLRRALAYLQGLLSCVERKNGWQLAEHAREANPYGMQRLLSQAVWDEDLVRDDLRNFVIEHLGDLNAILALDETSFGSSGRKSAGVKKQYCGTTGDLENCQVGVFLSYVTAKGHTLIDRELYLPLKWIQDRERSQEAGIPDTVRFQTKCELARQMIERIHHAHIPISWVVADTVYGSNQALRTWLQANQYSYVLAVACDEPIGIQTPDGRKLVEVRDVEALLLHAQEGPRLSMSQGTKGPRSLIGQPFPSCTNGRMMGNIGCSCAAAWTIHPKNVLSRLCAERNHLARDGGGNWSTLVHRARSGNVQRYGTRSV